MERARISRAVAMKIPGHKTDSAYIRYNILDNRDIEDTGKKLTEFLKGQNEGYAQSSKRDSRGGRRLYRHQGICCYDETHRHGQGFYASPSIRPNRKKQVVVGKETHLYGLARLFHISGENVGKELEVVQTLEEAYKIVAARPEDFTQRF